MVSHNWKIRVPTATPHLVKYKACLYFVFISPEFGVYKIRRRFRVRANLIAAMNLRFFTVPAALVILTGLSISSAVEPARSYIAIDVNTGNVLLEKASQSRVPVASLTKIATATVVLDWLSASRASSNQSVVVPPSVTGIRGANRMNLVPGDRITIRDALTAALLGSDNASAETLAHHVGMDLLNRQGRGGNPVSLFVSQLNALASRQGMSNTRFTNAHGLDSGRGYSSAGDIAKLAGYALKVKGFQFYVSQKSRNVSFTRNGTRRTFRIRNTNKLLGRNGIDGVKTGATRQAGPCLVLSASRKSTVTKLADGRTMVRPHRIVAVVLGAEDRFRSGQQLLSAAWQRYDSMPVGGPAEQPRY